jgi:hypothetical protein
VLVYYLLFFCLDWGITRFGVCCHKSFDGGICDVGANEVIGANYTVTTPFLKPLLIVWLNLV